MPNPAKTSFPKPQTKLAGFQVNLPDKAEMTAAIAYPASETVENCTAIKALDLLRLRPVNVPGPIAGAIIREILKASEGIGVLRKRRACGKIGLKHLYLPNQVRCQKRLGSCLLPGRFASLEAGTMTLFCHLSKSAVKGVRNPLIFLGIPPENEAQNRRYLSL